jgi:hypothetical protein
MEYIVSVALLIMVQLVEEIGEAFGRRYAALIPPLRTRGCNRDESSFTHSGGRPKRGCAALSKDSAPMTSLSAGNAAIIPDLNGLPILLCIAPGRNREFVTLRPVLLRLFLIKVRSGADC